MIRQAHGLTGGICTPPTNYVRVLFFDAVCPSIRNVLNVRMRTWKLLNMYNSENKPIAKLCSLKFSVKSLFTSLPTRQLNRLSKIMHL